MGEVEFKFFIYAYPAMGGCCGIDKKQEDSFLEMILKGEAPSREKLKDMFPAAFMRMEDKYGKNYWTLENVTHYWRVEHNRIIDEGEAGYEDATDKQKEICKTKSWEIKYFVGNGRIKLIDKDRKEIDAYNYRQLSLKENGYVATHNKLIVEEDSFENYRKYG